MAGVEVSFLHRLESRRRIARRLGQFGVAEQQFDRFAHAQRHVARREPLPALVRFGEVGPDAFDRAGQGALDAHGVFGRADGVGAVVHCFCSVPAP